MHRFDYDLMSQIRDTASSPSTLAEFLQEPAIISSLTSSATKKKRKTRQRRSSPHREPHGSSPTSVMGIVLAEEERQASHLKAVLRSTGDRLEQEIRRADRAEQRAEHAETRAREMASRIGVAENGQHTAELHSIRSKEEMQRLQMNLETMQRELRRANEDIDTLEAKKLEVEQHAAKSRDVAKKFQMALNDFQAREEAMEDTRRLEIQRWYDIGRQEGWDAGREDGFEEGKEEGFRNGKKYGLEEGRRTGRERGWREGSAQGQKEERQRALEAFDKFLREEMHDHRYRDVRMPYFVPLIYLLTTVINAESNSVD